ncbi:DUF1631 family protein [Luteimonas sp. MC1825]|uniref:DUF1631 family protein n=1 Tax=Luteimonas sp. MC1825 TaxID=2761107 RepID=UPI001613EBA7|nr:DUF1631 family protein [Luteimonas sp. MC1825]MBB6599874.1 DUF1631 family protein [Luteimonas sp. MC1825]QOC87588.1 DUF1631 family protein [Luteimonas sp. MC1825]
MRTPQGSGGEAVAGAQRAAAPPAQQLDALRQEFRARLQPLLAEAQLAAEKDLQQMYAEAPDVAVGDALANVAMLRRDALRHERRWQARIDAAFAGWPARAPTADGDPAAYALLSEGELSTQLIGQPAIEALQRRFADALSVVESRLVSLAARMGGDGLPANPFAPPVVVDAFLLAFPPIDCEPLLRQSLLRHYERLCGTHLGPAYAWLNGALAAGGFAMLGGSVHAAMVSQPVGTAEGASWRGRDGLAPRGPDDGTATPASRGGDAIAMRGTLLRALVRARRPARAADDTRRAFGDREFLAVLSLLQGSETPTRWPPADPAPFALQLRRAMLAGASGLGMGVDAALPSAAQDDALDITALLFDALRASACLAPGAEARLTRLAWPWIRLVLDDPQLFDTEAHPAVCALATIVTLWDGNPGSGDDAVLHALADAAADAIANGYQGEAAVIERALGELDAGSAPMLRRAAISERRAWQALDGSERLEAARRFADATLVARIGDRAVLPVVGAFLAGPWRGALVQVRLREGTGSARHQELLELADGMLRLDADAARARGAAVADGLLALEAPLRACLGTLGEDGGAIDMLLVSLAAGLALPDAPRARPEAAPLVADSDADAGQADDAAPGSAPGSLTGAAPEVGAVLVARDQHGATRHLRLAWRSPLTGRCLLVTRQGARHAVLSPSSMAAALASGELVARAGPDPVEAALRGILGA